MKHQTLFFSLFLLLSCNSTPAPSAQTINFAPKQAHYYLRFVETSKQLYAEVSFFGDSGAIAHPKGVFINQTEAFETRSTPNLKHSYRIARTETAPQPAYVVSYAPDLLKDSLRTRDTLTLPLLPKLSPVRPVLSKKIGLAFAWEGLPLTAEDKIEISITDSKNQTLTIEQVGLDQAQNIVLQPQGLETLHEGQATIKLFLQRVHTPNPLPCRRQYITEYYPKEISINVQN